MTHPRVYLLDIRKELFPARLGTVNNSDSENGNESIADLEEGRAEPLPVVAAIPATQANYTNDKSKAADDSTVVTYQGDSDGEYGIKAMVVTISGCEDSQTSADVSNVASFQLPDPNGKAGGACTSALLKGTDNQSNVQKRNDNDEHPLNSHLLLVIDSPARSRQRKGQHRNDLYPRPKANEKDPQTRPIHTTSTTYIVETTKQEWRLFPFSTQLQWREASRIDWNQL